MQRAMSKFTEPTGDATRLTVVELHEYRHTPKCVGVVDSLVGILDHEVLAVLPGDEAAQVSEEVPSRHRQPLNDHRDVEPLENTELLTAFDFDHLARHGWQI